MQCSHLCTEQPQAHRPSRHTSVEKGAAPAGQKLVWVAFWSRRGVGISTILLLPFRDAASPPVLHFSLSSKIEDAYIQKNNFLKILGATLLVDCYKDDHEFLTSRLSWDTQQPIHHVGQPDSFWSCPSPLWWVVVKQFLQSFQLDFPKNLLRVWFSPEQKLT